jgi:hypothetical protein
MLSALQITNKRKFLPELLGMSLYKTSKYDYFYAWNHKHATRKRPNKPIWYINEFGKCLLV